MAWENLVIPRALSVKGINLFNNRQLRADSTGFIVAF